MARTLQGGIMHDEKGNIIQDEKTGESIIRHPVPEKHCKEIEGAIKNQETYQQQFIMHSQAQINALQQLLDTNVELKRGQEVLTNALQVTCKKMGLPKDNWIYNIKDKCMELRKPPQTGAAEYFEDGKKVETVDKDPVHGK